VIADLVNRNLLVNDGYFEIHTMFANRQKLGLSSSNLLATCPQCFATRGRRAICPACSGINAQHSMNLFPNVAKIARKRLPTKSFDLHVAFLLFFIDISGYFPFSSLH
jgi:hypothetical protein